MRCSKIYHITLIVCAPYFVKGHFLVNNAIILCSFTFTAKENRKSHPHLSNLQFCHFDIII